VPETQRRKVPQEDSSRVDRPQAGWRGAHHCNQASHRRGAPWTGPRVPAPRRGAGWDRRVRRHLLETPSSRRETSLQ
jgi:hypothetical protein